MLNNNSHKITLYLFVSDASVYAWQFKMIERLLLQQNINTICWVNIDSQPNKTPLFLSFFYRIDGVLSNCKLSTLESKNINDFATANATINLKQLPLEKYFQQITKETDTSAIVVNLSINNLVDDILVKTPLHVLSVFIGNQPQVIAPLTGVVEFITGEKTITSGIQIEKESSKNNQTIFSSKTSIEPPSLCRTIETCLQKTSVFLARSIKNANNNSSTFRMLQQDQSTISIATAPVKTNLKLSQKSALISRYTLRVIKRIMGRLTKKEQWILLLGNNTSENKANQALSTFHKIIPPKEEFWADPFIVSYQQKHYLFIEVLRYERDLGHLSCMEIYDDGSYSQPKKILERPYHLSFPNIFEYEGVYYMIPETGDNETVELYEATSFPYEWKFKHNLMDNIRAYDSNLVFHNNLWWLFAAVAESKECPTTEELYVFYADSPISKHWTAHANNPIVSDASCARPAGKIMEKGSVLIRPSQDCAGSYGAGINFSEIMTLDKTNYKEKKINTLSADWDKTLTGVHTFNFDSKYTVSDAMFLRGKRA